VQSLHDDDNRAVTLVVEPAVKGVEEPLIRRIPSCVGERLLRFRGIVDQNEIGAAPGQHASGGGGEAITFAGGDELLHRVAVRRQAGREDPLIPRAHHDTAAVAGELIGEFLAIADGQDLRRRIVPQAPDPSALLTFAIGIGSMPAGRGGQVRS
jgi:hypothetical protein